MRKRLLLSYALAVATCVGMASQVWAVGVASSDRFGYTGVVKRYATLADAQNGINQVGADIAIGDRDLSLSIVDNVPSYPSNFNSIMGSWWYTTDPSGQAGWGNTTGNSGRGYIQLYDSDFSTVTSSSMSFSNFDGTYYTQFNLSESGVNADFSNDYARFWVDYQGSGADKVVFLDYSLDLQADGLQGLLQGDGLVHSLATEPTSVTGQFIATLQNVSTTYPQNNGFYVVTLNLDMTNWAYTNRNNLTGDPFTASEFIAPAASEPVPEPVTAGLATLALAGVTVSALSRRRQA